MLRRVSRVKFQCFVAKSHHINSFEKKLRQACYIGCQFAISASFWAPTLPFVLTLVVSFKLDF